MGGAEFYPSCTQVRVGGSGSGKPTDTVTFPGGYSDSDPGIFDPTVRARASYCPLLLSDGRGSHQVFDDDSKYVFPGPPISNLASTSAGITPPASATPSFPPEGASATAPASATGAGSGSGTSATHVATPSASAGTGAAAQGGKAQCRLKSRATVDASTLIENRPRHYSRIMRRIMHAS